mgnify:CR=1 FL=1
MWLFWSQLAAMSSERLDYTIKSYLLLAFHLGGHSFFCFGYQDASIVCCRLRTH